MSAKASRLRKAILRLEAARSNHVKAILANLTPMQPGTVVHLERKCGKPNCHCATGSGHPGTYLSFKHKGHTRLVYLPIAKRQKVEKQARSYRHFRVQRAALAKLGMQVLKLVDQLSDELRSDDAIGPGKED